MSYDPQNINPQQLIIRLKTFLSSSDLTDSPTARALYANYLQLNNQLSSRMINCSSLLNNRQKIEAVTLAQQEPPVDKLFAAMMFPERKLLLRLASLYSWELPAELNSALMADISQALTEMNDLRPLLAEFRRIARSDQLENKLRLLREINRRDTNNQEWERPLREVENQYLTKLIDRAQQTIINEQYSELENIYDELKNTQWVVAVPTVVMQKINKIVTGYRMEMRKKRAEELLLEVNNALGIFDVNALEDALFCYNDHCATSGYEPEKNELIQLREAEKFLSEEKEKQNLLQEFRNGIAVITSLLDNNAPIIEIDKVYSALKTTGHDIPLHISRRIEQYREELDREIRIRHIMKACRIIACAAVIIFAIVGGTSLISRSITEKRLVGSIREKIAQKDLPGALLMLAEVEQQHPGIAKGSKISAVRADIAKLEKEDKERQALLEKLFSEIEKSRNVWPPDPAIAGKITEISSLVKSDVEKQKLAAVQKWYKEISERYSTECENEFYVKLNKIKEMRKRIIGCIEDRKFTLAEKELFRLKKIIDEIRNMRFLKPELLSENNKLLSCVFALDEMLSTHRSNQAELNEALEAMCNAATLSELEEALRNYISIFKKNNAEKQTDHFLLLQNDIETLKSIFNWQDSGTRADITNAYLRDVQQLLQDRQNADKACTDLQNAFKRLENNNKRQKLYFLRFKDASSKNMDFLVSGKISEINGVLKFTRDDGVDVEVHPIRFYNRQYRIIVRGDAGDEKIYSMCTLIYPADIAISTVRKTAAAHQVLTGKIAGDMTMLSTENVVAKGIGYLEMILTDTYCVEYWKMMLASRVVQALAPLDDSQLKPLQRMQAQLDKLQSLNTSDKPVYNELLKEKIREFLSAVKFSELRSAGKQISFNRMMFNDLASTKYQLFGTALEVDGKVKYSVVPALRGETCDILCFDENTQQSILVGRYTANGIIINEKYRSKVINRLLFTTAPCGSMAARSNGFKNNKDKYPVIKWPEFWPQNLKGDKQ